MSIPKLHSFQHKLAWASKLLYELEGHVMKWFDGKKHYSLVVDPDPNELGYYFLKLTADKIPTDPYSLIIGDIIQNLRSSLDHLAFSLAESNIKPKPLPPSVAKRSQFPIISEQPAVPGQVPKAWSDAVEDRLKCVCSGAQSVIERVQPYNLGGAFKDHPLWVLAELSNIDKHRTLHIGAARVSMFASPYHGMYGEFTPKPGIIDDDPEVARVRFDPPFQAHVSIKDSIYSHMSIAFGDDPFKGKPVTTPLFKIRDFIESDVVAPLMPFL